MIQERDVKAKMFAVIQNEISILEFVRWIMANSWNMHNDSSSAAIDLVSDIHLLMSERDDRSISDDGFRRELLSLLSNVVIEINDAPAAVRARTAVSVPLWMPVPHWIPLLLPNLRPIPLTVGASGSATPTLVLPRLA